MEGGEEGEQLRGLEGMAGRTGGRLEGAKGESTVQVSGLRKQVLFTEKEQEYESRSKGKKNVLTPRRIKDIVTAQWLVTD